MEEVRRRLSSSDTIISCIHSLFYKVYNIAYILNKQVLKTLTLNDLIVGRLIIKKMETCSKKLILLKLSLLRRDLTLEKNRYLVIYVALPCFFKFLARASSL